MLRWSPGPFRGVSPARRRHLALALSLGLVGSTVGLGAGAAGASPQSDLSNKQARAKQLEATIEAAHQRAEILDEQYLQAQSAVAMAQTKIAAAERAIADAEVRAAGLRRRLAGRAARLYMGAGNVDFLSIDATNVQALGSRAKYSEAAAEQDGQLLGDLKLVEDQLNHDRKDLERQKKDAQARQHDADRALRSLQQATAQEEQTLAAVKGDIATLVKNIEDARRRAEEAAARAEFARRQAAARAARAAAASNSALANVAPYDVPAPSPGAAAAVAYAWAQLGKPYRYAGTGPDAYDCSGLTMMAWAQAGVSMPHGSIAQGNMFPRVPDDQLQPGDLVIYYPDHHHVGMYVGKGMTISATHTGDYVRLQPVFRSGYQFAVRPG